MTEYYRLFRTELLKLLKHRLTWAVLVGLLLIMGGEFYDQYRRVRLHDDFALHVTEFEQAEAVVLPTAVLPNTASTSGGELLDTAFAAEATAPYQRLQTVTLPGAFSQLQLMTDWLNLATILLAIIAVGHELSWGTLQMVLVRGVPRSLWLWAKLGAITAVLTLYLLTLWLAAGIIGLIITQQVTTQSYLTTLDGLFWLTQASMLLRIWLVMVTFLAFTLAINIWLNKPGPAFSLLFLSFWLSWFAYLSSSIAAVFALGNPNFDMANFSSSGIGRLITWLPHYNGRLILYSDAPHVLAEFDSSIHVFMHAFGLTTNFTRALLILLGYGFIPFLLALRGFNNRDIGVV